MRNVFKVLFLIVGAYYLAGCATWGDRDGYNDGQRFLSTGKVPSGYGVRYAEGVQRAFTPDEIKALREAQEKARLEDQQKTEQFIKTMNLPVQLNGAPK